VRQRHLQRDTGTRLRRRRERQKDNSMRISSIIEQLSEIQKVHGDLQVIYRRKAEILRPELIVRNVQARLCDIPDRTNSLPQWERVAAIEVD